MYLEDTVEFFAKCRYESFVIDKETRTFKCFSSQAKRLRRKHADFYVFISPP